MSNFIYNNVRNIYLPELLSLNIRDYSLYPNGLDYTFDFVKGFNLILGGNGMGKTTFVSLIKYALIGNYKKQYEYSRTYKENKIEKRERNSDDFFRNRMDPTIATDGPPSVTLKFKVNGTHFTITRSLIDISIQTLFIDGVKIEGQEILESKYEAVKNSVKNEDGQAKLSMLLPFLYENSFQHAAGISFDDLIFFVNYILFFGEDHKTVLWEEDVQRQLFNTFFNSPELNTARQDAEREAKYFDSRSRHKSEDKRAIRKVLDRIEQKEQKGNSTPGDLIKLKEKIEYFTAKAKEVHEVRKRNSSKISILENDKNTYAQMLDELESTRNKLINTLSFSEYKHQHRLYDSFLKNIQTNHVCPLCNNQNEELYVRAVENQDRCWVCDSELINDSEMNADAKAELQRLNDEYTAQTRALTSAQNDIKVLEAENRSLDNQFKKLDVDKRQSLSEVRELEYENSKNENPTELQPFYDEIEKLTAEQDDFAEKRDERRNEANRIAQLIEDTVLANVQNFSNQFSLYAQKFLGVPCNLTYERLDDDVLKKFYPMINGTVRKTDLELSESQRFFIDHSFRMSILTHFYTTPTFYIVETPDSSLDLSYEKNAADVFSSFLEKPYSLILTSNLNNSSFVNYILSNENRDHEIVPLFEIAKKSVIQQSNDTLSQLYNKIKNG
ncbi:AAA family ATPase [Pedobacter agri]|uniref:AAA family ATPase n=1 Tax=Pedobacter agri TaxID=454586 RepID=UPI00292E06A9|nr:AAA family ATPase [Pedobacter agri]